MKAVLIERPQHARYGDFDRPPVTEGHVIVRVAAVGICMSDVELLDGTRPASYVRYPVQPGHEWCGTIAEVGPGVRGLEPGQRVAVEGHNFCGVCFWCCRGETNLCATYSEFGFTLPGAFAEYVRVRADLAHPFSERLPFDIAALTEPAACARHGAARAGVRAGDLVVAIGPGTIGLLALAWSTLARPAHTIVVGKDRDNEPIARAMGATGYVTSAEDATALVFDLSGGRGADVVFDATGSRQTVPLAFDLVRRGGTVVMESISGSPVSNAIDTDLFALKDLHVHGAFAYTSRHFHDALAAIDRGEINPAPLVTHTFPLQDYAQAFELVRTRREPVVKVILHP